MSYGYDPYGGYEGQPAPEQNHLPTAAAADSAAGRGRRRRAAPADSDFEQPLPQPAQYHETRAPYEEPSAPHEQYFHAERPDPQWERSGLGWERAAWDKAQRTSASRGPAHLDYFDADGMPDRYRLSLPPRPSAPHEPQWSSESSGAPETARISQQPNRAQAPVEATARDSFGAAGVAVVVGITAVAALPVLAVVVAVSQVALAIGWFRTADMRQARRTTALVALIALAGSWAGYRLAPEKAPGVGGAALGVGFVFLAADQLLRAATPQHRRGEALAVAVAGAAFAVLPAGYLVAQRQDSALAAACALAAAVAVLCESLVGGGGRPVGLTAGTVAACAVGALTAVSLAANAGASGGAIGGLLAGLLAVIGVRVTVRLAAEGADVRISSQLLPATFAAIAAVCVGILLR